MPSAPWVQERVWRAQQTVVTTTLGQLQVWAALTQPGHEGKHRFIPKLKFRFRSTDSERNQGMNLFKYPFVTK